MVDLDLMRKLADACEQQDFDVTAGAMREAADEIETLRRVRDGMTPHPDVRPMHYRAAALAIAAGIVLSAGNLRGGDVDMMIAERAETIARAMLAAEGRA